MQATKSHRFVDPLEWIRIVSFHSRKLFVRSLCVLRGLHSFIFYFLVPIQVHLCQIVSRGPCLCLDSHHLQN